MGSPIWCIRYTRACSSYECFILMSVRLTNKLLWRGYVNEHLKSSLWKFYGLYWIFLNNMKSPSLECYTACWRKTTYSDTIHRSESIPIVTLLLIWTLLPIWTIYLIVRNLHRTFATGAASQQRTLNPPDTLSCPTLGLACVLMLRSISLELVLFPDFGVSNIPRYIWFR